MQKIIATLTGLRIQKGMGQSEIAQAVGVSIPTLCKWETARKSPTLENLERWCNALGHTLKISID